MVGSALILGATGRFGRNVAEAFWNAGWTVRLFDRTSDDLNTAAAGADVIVNGWNPAYPDWEKQAMDLTHQVIAAARLHNATVIFPGNVYVYGADAPQIFAPETPHNATNPLGRIRIDMEAAYRAADVQTIILRAGDFLDTAASGNWFDKVMAPSLTKGKLTYPGNPDSPHAWAYLPDFAIAIEKLARMRSWLPRFTDLSFEGYTLTGNQMATVLSEGLSRSVEIKQLAWWPVKMAAPVFPLARHICEMRYLWDKPHQLDGSALASFLPDLRHTDPVEAFRTAALAAKPDLMERPHPPKPSHGGLSRV
ncbi:MAG: epimerase [Pseudomonadota bacterium]|nr:epimerase [Pseudomonadota bacterium]